MKIGIFDSGLGGLVIANTLMQAMPEYDYVYLGDTIRLPYGDKPTSLIYEYTQKACEFLFNQDCVLIIIACNTATAAALRKIQQNFIPAHYQGRNVLGIIRPTVEIACQSEFPKIGVIATASTVKSQSYEQEIYKLNPAAQVISVAATGLVPAIEANNFNAAKELLPQYLAPLIEAKISSLILGCTHYPLLKSEIRAIMGNIPVLSQDELIADSLKSYLERHPEYALKISKNSNKEFFVTQKNPNSIEVAKTFYNGEIDFSCIDLL